MNKILPVILILLVITMGYANASSYNSTLNESLSITSTMGNSTLLSPNKDHEIVMFLKMNGHHTFLGILHILDIHKVYLKHHLDYLYSQGNITYNGYFFTGNFTYLK